MRLTPEDVERFYHIWFALLRYVNDQRHLGVDLPASVKERPVSPQAIAPIREALWADDALRDQFIAANPAGLAPADLDLVASWDDRVSGNFYVFRHLKKYSVLLTDTSPAHAYGVLGLVSAFEEIVGPALPVLVQAVLLPFEGQITYDSLLVTYPISFGAGIRAGLRDAYRNAQEREGIITDLEETEPAGLDAARAAVAARDAKILTAFRKDLAQSGLSTKMVDQHTANITAFAERVLEADDPPRGLLDLDAGDVQTYLGAGGPTANPVSLKRFIRFLRDTERLDYEVAEGLSEDLKDARG